MKAWCDHTLSTEMPSTWACLGLNSGSAALKTPNSSPQTGLQSAG